MNIANKLTLFRVVIVPFFVFFMCFTGIEYRYLFALILFILASITDMLAGRIARKYNMVTNFGKFLEPGWGGFRGIKRMLFPLISGES